MKGMRIISSAKNGGAGQAFGEKDFDTLVYRRRNWASSAYEQRYSVYKNETEIVIVLANSAKEAIEVAGFDNPFKVVRGQASTVGSGTLVKEGRLIDEDLTPEHDADAKPEDAVEAPKAPSEANVDPDLEAEPDPESEQNPDSEPETSPEDLPETPSETD